jgi:hypothetical protein
MYQLCLESDALTCECPKDQCCYLVSVCDAHISIRFALRLSVYHYLDV